MFDIDTIIKNGLEHIASKQQEDGSFASLSSFDRTDFTHAVSYSTTFLPSIILACLNSVVENEKYRECADPIRQRAATFLLKERSDDWSFNYWARGASEKRTMPYPDDLDDTFCALSALARYDPAIINGEVLAAVAAMLTRAEAQVGGPYRTWLVAVSSGSWADIDLVVNSNIGYFLGIVGIHLPNIETLIGGAVSDRITRSPYYPSAAQVLYFISRCYKNSNENVMAKKVIAAILEFRNNNAGAMTPLENTITMTALINCGAVSTITPGEIEKLLAVIAKGGWEPYAFCVDPAREGKTSYAGSSALTAALAIETLTLYQNSSAGEKKKVDRIHKRMIALAKSDICRNGLPTPLRVMALQKINDVDDERITLLAHEFKAALGKYGTAISSETVDRLALGNVYGWIAYAIYDDILDDETDPLLLPAANFFLRSLARIYEREGATVPEIAKLFSRIMNTIDGANAWEQQHCRLPIGAKDCIPEGLPIFGDYGNLADRSIGHAMGPLTELVIAGYGADSKDFQNIFSLFRHYLIARQLHDDAHDWADDLLRGRVNSVGALTIKIFRNKNNHRASTSIADALSAMRELFWEEGIDVVARLIENHIAAARQARQRSTLIGDTNFMEDVLASLEAGTKKAIAERNDALLFLAHYHPSTPPNTSARI
jgi:hypothetical protein